MLDLLKIQMNLDSTRAASSKIMHMFKYMNSGDPEPIRTGSGALFSNRLLAFLISVVDASFQPDPTLNFIRIRQVPTYFKRQHFLANSYDTKHVPSA